MPPGTFHAAKSVNYIASTGFCNRVIQANLNAVFLAAGTFAFLAA